MESVLKYILLVLVLLLVTNTYAQSNIKKGDPAPEINITDWVANIPEDKSLDNKFLILDFWASWCRPCLRNVPHMNNLQAKFKNNNIQFLHITYEHPKLVKKTLEKVDFQTAVVTDISKQTQVNFGDGVSNLVYYPMSVLIDPQGIIKWYGDSELLTEGIIKDFLEGKEINVRQLSMDSHLYKKREPEYYINKPFSLEVWSDLSMDPNIDRITYIVEYPNPDSTRKKAPGMQSGLGAFFENEPLSKLLWKLFPKKQFYLSDFLQSKTYNFYFVDHNLDSDSGEKLLQEIADQLSLKVEFSRGTGIQYEIIEDNKNLLAKVKTKGRRKKGSIKNRGHFIDQNLSLATLAYILSINTNDYWLYNGKNGKKYAPVINIKDKDAIFMSLKQYGIKVIESEREIETVIFSQKE